MTPLKEMPEITEPAQAELALAMAIVKHKPPGTTVKEYIGTIRESITSKKDKPEATNKFFNSVKHWHSAYLDAKSEAERLKNAIRDLHYRNTALIAALPPAKRKAFDAMDKTPDTNGKRAKIDGVDCQSQQAPLNPVPEELLNPQQEQGKSFLRYIAALDNAIQQPLPNDRKEKTEYWKGLALKAVLVCKMAERGLLTVVRIELYPSFASEYQPGTHQALKNKEPSFIAVKNAVELSFRMVLQALHKFPKSTWQGAWRSQRQVIYYIVCLFESTMTALFECSFVATRKKKPEAVESTTGAEQQQNEAGGPSGATSPTQHHIAHALVDLLCNMAIMLNKRTDSDRPVIEGVLFLIMDRLGELLAFFTFGGEKASTNPNADVPPPAGLITAREKMVDADCAQMEAKYLVFFLKRLLKEKPQFAFTHSNWLEDPQYKLEKGIKHEAMKTLLQAIFGRGEALFQGGLKRVATPEPVAYEEPPEPREEFAQWLTGELWALIGWDILEYPRPEVVTKESAETEEPSESEDSSDSSA